jgi:hypothetical protein
MSTVPGVRLFVPLRPEWISALAFGMAMFLWISVPLSIDSGQPLSGSRPCKPPSVPPGNVLPSRATDDELTTAVAAGTRVQELSDSVRRRLLSGGRWHLILDRSFRGLPPPVTAFVSGGNLLHLFLVGTASASSSATLDVSIQLDSTTGRPGFAARVHGRPKGTRPTGTLIGPLDWTLGHIGEGLHTLTMVPGPSPECFTGTALGDGFQVEVFEATANQSATERDQPA